METEDGDAGSGAVHQVIKAVRDDSDTVAGCSHGEFDEEQSAVSDYSENAGASAVIDARCVFVFFHFSRSFLQKKFFLISVNAFSASDVYFYRYFRRNLQEEHPA